MYLLHAIFGIEIEVTRLQGKWKVSQNRTASDRAGLAAGLASADSSAAHGMAALVSGGA